MILAAPQVRAILAGRKTQMRVPVREPGTTLRKNGTTRDTTPFRPHIGRPIVISQTARVDGKDISTPVCNVLVTHYEHALLHNPTPDGIGGIDIHAALAEGHKTSDDFKCWWVREHDRTWVNNLIRRLEIEPGDDLLVERFEKRHTLRPVWVITFKVDTAAAPRFLAPTGRGDALGYTTVQAQAIPDEPEAVDELTQRRISDAGRVTDALAKAGAAGTLLDELQAFPAQRARLKQAAMAHGIDIRPQLRMLDRAQEHIERKIREQAQGRQRAA